MGTLTAGEMATGTLSACDLNPFQTTYGRFKNAYPAISQFLNSAPPPSQVKSNIVVSINPNPVPEGQPDANGFAWGFTMTLRETAGVSTRVTSLNIAGVDYSSKIRAWFGTDTIPASGSISVSLRANAPDPPQTETLEFGGADIGTGAEWSVPTSITFLAGPAPTQAAPAFAAARILNGASFQQTAAPGMILSVFGQHLANGTEAASKVPLPTQMQGTTAAVNGVPAPLYYVSPSQLNLQIPYSVAPGAATLTISVNGQSASQTFNVSEVAPGIFTGSGHRLVPSSKASRGASATLFLTGQGAVSPSIPTGSAPPNSWPLSSLPAPAAPVSVTVGGVPARIAFVGIPYGLVGVAQINFEVPEGIASGDQPVVVHVGGADSPAAYVTVNP